MTKGEYEARLRVVQYLIYMRRQYEFLHGSVEKFSKGTKGFNIEGYIPVTEIEQHTGVKVVLIRNALKGCTLVNSKTGKLGGYRLSVAPLELNDRAKAIAAKNKKKNPIKWQRTVPLTLDDLIGEYTAVALREALLEIDVSKKLIKSVREQLKKHILYEFHLSAFGVL